MHRPGDSTAEVGNDSGSLRLRQSFSEKDAYRSLRAGPRREGIYLLEESKRVRSTPPLDYLAILEAGHDDGGEFDLFAGRLKACRTPVVRPREDRSNDHLAILGYHIPDIETEVGESLQNSFGVASKCLDSTLLLWVHLVARNGMVVDDSLDNAVFEVLDPTLLVILVRVQLRPGSRIVLGS